MKQFLILFFFYFVSLLSAQNMDSLTIREAYDFSVGDTFQYNIYYRGAAPFQYLERQVVIKDKKVDLHRKKTKYIQQVEEYYLIQTDVQSFNPYYSNKTEIKEFDISDTAVRASRNCPVIVNPLDLGKCFDSIKIGYGGRKTLRHEYFQFEHTYKEHYAHGLGNALLWYRGPDGYRTDESLFYYNKGGQTWGNYSNTIALERSKIMPLTVREVYDFNIGDVFIYEHKRFVPPFVSTLNTRYERRTILSKTITANKDSIIYTYKSESAHKDSLGKVTVRIDTLTATDLDSLAISKTSPSSNIPKTYPSDIYTFFPTNRKMNTRSLICDCFDFHYKLSVAQGIGKTLEEWQEPVLSRLIYYKKGTDIWGTFVDFKTSLHPPSVSTLKIILSPNPVNDVLTIGTDAFFNRVKILNTHGHAVVEGKRATTIDVSQLPNGLYFLQIFEGDILRDGQKFVVQR